jgi:large subunit ribosomal protein L19
MANHFIYKDKTYAVGDSVGIKYKFKEGEKERQQLFKGIVIRVKGNDEENKMITIRKVSKSGIGIERIIPLKSPFISSIKLDKKGSYQKSKLYFIRNLSDSQLRHKLYHKK